MTDFDRDETTDLIEFEDAEPTHLDEIAALPMADLINAPANDGGTK